MPKRVLMIIAPDKFRDEEYFEPKAILEEEGVAVVTASLKEGPIKGMLGKTAEATLTLDKASPELFDAVVFVGGVGAREYFRNPRAIDIARSAYLKGKIVAAICIAPVILANAGILNGKKATVLRDDVFVTSLKLNGAKYTGESVTVDGKIITANSPEASKRFGEILFKALIGDLGK